MKSFNDLQNLPPLSRVEKALLVEKINLAWRRKVMDDQFMLETKDLALQNRTGGPKTTKWRSGRSYKNQSLLGRKSNNGRTSKGEKRIERYNPEVGLPFDIGSVVGHLSNIKDNVVGSVADAGRRLDDAQTQARREDAEYFADPRNHTAREPSIVEVLKNGVGGVAQICRAIDQFRKLTDSFLEAITYTQPIQEQHFMITLVARLEDIMALYFVISRSTNLVTVLGGIHLYLRTVFPNGSRAMQIGQYIAKILEATDVDDVPHDFEFSESDGKYKPEGFSLDNMKNLSSEFESWFKDAGEFWTNLPRLKNSQFRTKFIKIFDTLVALGLVPEKEGEFSLRVANIEFMRRKQTVEKGTWNFIEHIVDSCQFITERAIFLIKTGDLYAALLGEDELNDFDKEFSIISAASKVAHDEEVLTQYKVNGELQFKDRASYTRRLVALIAVSEDFLKAKKLHPNLLSAIRAKNVVLRSFEVDDMQRNLSRPMIERPYSANIFGGSSVGKSTVNTLVMRAILEAGGYQSDPDYLVNLKAGLKFDDATQPHHNGATFDDYCNTRAEFLDSSPTQMIIDIINNARAQINRANANEKGKFYYNFKAVTITTNQKDLHANKFSVCPESILRRLNCTLTVKLKREAIGFDGGINPSVFIGPDGQQLMMPDAWNIDIEKAVIVRSSLGDSVEYEMVKEDASIYEVLDYITADAKKFYASQKEYVGSMLKFNTVKLCKHGCPCTECPICKAEKSTGEFLLSAFKAKRVGIRDVIPAYQHIYDSFKCGSTNLVEDGPELYCVPADYMMEHDEGLLETKKLPDEFAKIISDFIQEIDESEYSDTMQGDEFGAPSDYYEGEAGLETLLPAWRKRFNNIDPKIVCKPLSELWQDERKFRAVAMGISMGTLAALGTIFLAAKFMMGNAVSYEAEMAVTKPKPTEFDEAYDHEQEKKWKEVEFKPIETQEACKTTTLADMENLVHKNLAVVEYSTESGGKVVAHSNAFPVCGNYWLLPYHTLIEGVKLYVRLSRNDKRVTSCVAKGTITPKSAVRIPGKDLILVQITGSLNPDLTKFFPLENKQGIHSKVYKNCGTFAQESELVNLNRIEKASFNNRDYVTNWTHKTGTIVGKSRCMSAVIHEESSSISGFHVGSNAKAGTCHIAMITLAEVKNALKEIEKNTYTEMRPHDATPFTPEVALYGKKYFGEGKIPDNNPVRYADADASFEVLGVGQPKRTFKSVIVPSKICTATEEVYDTPRTHGKPYRMNSYIHWQRDMDKFTHPSGDFEEEAWRKAKLDLRVAFLKSGRTIGWGKTGKDNVKYEVFDEETVVNGADGVAMVDKIPMKTSAGQPINKCKKDIWLEDPEREGKYFLDAETRAKCEDNESKLASGQRINTNFRMHLKDEPKGVDVEKVRLMAGAEANFTCTVRKYTLSAVRAIQMHWTEFECAVGINAYSPQWSQLYNYLSAYGVNNAIAGDYSGFDKRVTPKALMAAWEVFIEFCKAGGADEEAMSILRGIATETSYPIYEFNGAMIQAYGSMPSGHPLTVVINNIQNSLYMRYAYYKLAAEHTTFYPNDFRSHVRLMCYGDDNIMTVKGCPWFNQINISAALDKAGIVYTDEAKTGLADRYKNLSELSFLKRSFRWSEECKEWFAPIEEASILKTLFCRHSDSPETDTKLAVDALDKAANTEWFLHGEEAHATHIQKLRQIAIKARIDNLVNFKRYHELVYDYHLKYHGDEIAIRWCENHPPDPIQIGNGLQPISEVPDYDLEYSPEMGLARVDEEDYSSSTQDSLLEEFPYVRERAVRFSNHDIFVNQQYDVTKENLDALAEINNNEIDLMRVNEEICSCHHSSRSLEVWEVPQITGDLDNGRVPHKNLKGIRNAFRRMARSLRTRLTIARFSPKRLLASKHNKESPIATETNTQDGSLFTVIPTEAVDTVENVTFTNNDARESVHIYSEPDSSYGSGMTTDANLGAFLSRPVRINTAVWNVNSSLAIQFNPWQLYLEDPQVQRKLANFKLLRGTLEVGAYINASAFYAGNALVAYEPLPAGRNFPLANFDNVSFLTRATQLPRYTLVSTKSKGGTMHLPFMFPNNWFNIPEQDWNNMGTIIVRSYSDLVNANGATDPINITFFARMTNVDICMPTSYIAESGEYTEGGVISKPASYISSIAQALTKVPVIKPYAIATQMVADAVGGIARIFGYSRPRILERDCIVHPRYIGELAVTDQDEVRFSLAADSKRELTIDPRTVGLSGVDEMIISNIAEKETFLTSFTWSVNDNIDTVLWSTFVHPQLSVIDSVLNTVQTTALGAVTAPFTYWCGGLKFRFILARPATYQGRMTISFDGQGPPGADYNTHYRNVVDIQDNDDFSITLPWAAAKPFLKTLTLDPAVLTNLYGSGARDPLQYDSEIYNGVMDVRVANRIAATSSLTPDINVYVFVSAASDYQVHRLTSDNYNKITYYDPEAGMMESDVDGINNHEAQNNMGHSIMNTDPNALRVNIGERIVSLRAALKRYNLTTIYCNDSIPNGENRRWTIGDVTFPEFRGKTFNPISTTSSGEPYCFNNTTLLTYIAPAFVAWRGSLNLKDIYTTLDNRFQSPMIVTTDKGINGDFTIRPSGSSNPLNVLNVNQGTATDYIANDFSSLGNGCALTEMTVQPCLPYEVPWYANVRFSLVGYDEGQYHTINVYGRSPNTAATDQLFRFQSIGEDFNFFFWTGLPPLYYTPDDP